MPAISTLSIEHYRGFYDGRTIEFAIPTGSPGSGLTILVGPNNSGKTTVVDAIRLLSANGPGELDIEHRHEGHAVRITLANNQGKAKTLTNPALGAITVFEGDPQAYPRVNHIKVVPSRRAWASYASRGRMEPSNYWQQMTQHPKENPDMQLVTRLAHLSTGQKQDYDRLLRELLPELSAWRIELSRGSNFIQYATTTGARHSSDLFGDGMASLFRIALAILDAVSGDIVLIDEPELSLHPQAQKALATVLSRAASNNQVIVTTHSTYFANWSDIGSGARVFRLHLEANGVSVGHVRPETFDAFEGSIIDWQKPSLLDAVAKEVFFADEVVFLEGQEDVGLLRNFAQEKTLPQLAAFGYGAGGAGNLAHFLRMAADLGIPACAVFDGDQRELAERARAEFPKAMIEVLPVADMRDKPERDAQGRETAVIAKEGLFDRHGRIKAAHEPYLAGLLLRIRKFFDGQP